ncbi:ABC1 kinase family protein [Cytobacillus purgationiresistens]|uniref:Ubiquinone biosynthesis protein n=1 Tax=Cytobacillus purgationiresistens TaxID=863449 RepID=A0ABU0AIS0_9BACI|nr:AarF/ABC1/UbiB kinase family protein [Cytobacillus purgationiresistens]MDQ0270606.1 ubiquinone biosynthesis protein [Cytobacillus purgationiresistens]
MHRYREIAVAFSRNGFGFFVKELGLHEFLSLPKRLLVKGQKGTHTKTTGERIRLFLEELGPTFVKMGQIASTRPDIIPNDIIVELEKLQDHVQSFPFEEVKRIVEKELGMEINEVFSEFQEEPLGSASIGQVHFGVLHTGEKVAVKVQRPHIEKVMKTDLEILQEIAKLAEHRQEWAANYQVTEIVDEFSKALLAELDYSLEGRNAGRIAQQFKDDPRYRIPKVFWDYSTKKVLTMDYIEGTYINELEEIHQKGYDKKLLAERMVEGIFQQILIDGTFHADPHPGNVSVLPGEVIVFMDFGMVGRLTPEMKSNFATLVIAMMRQSTDGVIKAIMRMGAVPDDVDIDLLRSDVDLLREKYYDVPFSQVSIGEAVNDLFSVANHHHIHIPTDLTLVGKALLTMEGVVEKLDPDISIVKIAEPFGRRLILDRYRPDHVVKDAVDHMGEYWGIFADTPKNIKEIIALIKKGKVPLELNLPDSEKFLTRIDRISNRLAFSIVLLSFSIIMVGLIVGSAMGRQSSLLWNIPAVEIGFVIALLMFVFLIYTIFRAGRF